MGSAAGHHSVCSHTTEDGGVSGSESKLSHNEGDGAGEDDDAKEKGGIKTLSDGQVASDGEEGQECPHTQDTLTGISQVFSTHEDTDPESEEELPTDEALRNEAWQKVWVLDTRFNAWHHNKIAKDIMGWDTRDTMICDLPKHGKMQPNYPDPVGLPLDYMGECQVFNGIQSDIYDLCRLYTLGMTGDPPEFPVPQEPVTHGQIRDLLKSAQSISWPYLILAHSADLVMAISMLREPHLAVCL